MKKLLLALCALAVSACGADPDPNQDDVCEAPPIGVTAEALSSVDCNKYSDTGYSSGNAFPITLVTIDGKPVEIDTANAYYVMAEAAQAAGVTLKVVSGFRTMGEQEYLYGCYVNCSCNNCNLAAKPGYSNHQSGHALDLNTSSGGVYDWLAANGPSFGFNRTVPSEAWHWEWWGGGPGGGPCAKCQPHCEGSKIVGADCGSGDCAAYGATCVDDAKGVRCASVFCPATGQKKVCVDDKLIGDCNDGAITTGDCSAYGTVCVDDEKGARCVIAFCADKPTQAHDVCLPDGNLGHCDDIGGIEVEECPTDQACTASASGLGCGSTTPEGGGSGAGVGSGGSGGSGWGSGGSSKIAPTQGGASGKSAGHADDVEGGCRLAGPVSGVRAPLWVIALALALRMRSRTSRSRRPSAG